MPQGYDAWDDSCGDGWGLPPSARAAELEWLRRNGGGEAQGAAPAQGQGIIGLIDSAIPAPGPEE